MAENNEVFFTGARGPVSDFKKGLHNYSKYNDPTYLGFLLLFDWFSPDDPSGSFYSTGSPLLSGGIDESKAGSDPSTWEVKEGTAMGYLKNNGEYTRMKYLNAFINTLKAININMPWYWQSIEGLDTAAKTGYMIQPYSVEKDAMITITCLESIDLKMTSLMDFYKNAVYDFEYRRVIIPENLRKFRLTIYVEEIRKFQVKESLLGKFENSAESGLNRLDPSSNLHKDLSNKASAISNNSALNSASDWLADKDSESLRFINSAGAKLMLDFQHCEFLPDESTEYLSTVSMSLPETATQKIAFKYERVREQNTFPLRAETIETKNSTGNVGLYDKDKLNEKSQGLARSVANNAISDVRKKATAYAKSLLLGNVHGFSASDIGTALQQGTIQGISSEIGQAASAARRRTENNLTGNTRVFEPGSPDSILSGNTKVFEPGSPDSILSGNSNVHNINKTGEIYSPSGTDISGTDNIFNG